MTKEQVVDLLVEGFAKDYPYLLVEPEDKDIIRDLVYMAVEAGQNLSKEE